MKIQWQMSSLKNSLRYIMIIGCYDMTFILMTTCKSVNAWELFFGAKKKKLHVIHLYIAIVRYIQ